MLLLYNPFSKLYSHEHLGLQVISFLSDFLTKILHAFLISHAYNTHHLDLDHSNHIWEGVKIIDFLIMTFSLASCHFHPSWKVQHVNWFCFSH